MRKLHPGMLLETPGPVTAAIKLADETNLRYFHGYVSKFRQLTPPGRRADWG